jgi:hypothetical protein
MTRVFFLFDSENLIVGLAQVFSMGAFYMSSFAIMVLSTVIGIYRFYKNMYSSEGYLTFTLPVKNYQHIFVKLLGAVTCNIVSALTVVAAGAIVLSDDSFNGVFSEVKYSLASMFYGVGTGNRVLFIIEFVILALLSPIMSTLVFYACISAGQTAKKNKIFMSFVWYIVYYMVSQVASLVFTVILSVIIVIGEAFIYSNPVTAIQIGLILNIVFQVIASAVMYLISLGVMNKKLNLE